MPTNPVNQDRRIQRTQQALRDALLELVPEKGYSSISIQELTDRANVGKATFYLHYRDKDELLYEIIEMVLAKLSEKIKSLPRSNWTLHDPRPPRIAFEFAVENARFIKIMMDDPSGLKFFQRLQKIVANLVYETMDSHIQSFHTKPMVPLEFFSNHFAGSMLATIEWWIENGMIYSIDEMVEMVTLAGSTDREKLLGVELT